MILLTGDDGSDLLPVYPFDLLRPLLAFTIQLSLPKLFRHYSFCVVGRVKTQGRMLARTQCESRRQRNLRNLRNLQDRLGWVASVN